MKRAIGGLLLAAWLASGLFVVQGTEQAIVRRFGRADERPWPAGLHFTWLWPFSQVDRIKVNELRTVSVGLAVSEELATAEYLQPFRSVRQAEFVTGDKNVLHLQLVVQYRVSDPRAWLLGTPAPERLVKLFAERAATEALSQSGVDYVHPLGLTELQKRMTERLQQLVDGADAGIFVESVVLSDVRPPPQVKRAFLDVANARNERERRISEAEALAEQSRQRAEAEAGRMAAAAETDRQQRVTRARGSAARFHALIDALERDARAGRGTYAQLRSAELQRNYLAVMERVFPRLQKRVLLDGSPADLTIGPEGLGR